MNAPIIFCHYGNSPYLKYVIKCAKLHNPNKEIILIGDKKNASLSRSFSIKHLMFDDYNKGELIEVFHKVYQPIQGNEHPHIKGGRDWLNFVFRRWFYVYNVCLSEKIQKFWHFDSDNMLLVDLEKHEHKFKNTDCTEQCNGMCINGYISNIPVLKGYLEKINELFQRKDYLQKQQNEFKTKHPKFAFTEMRAYETYKEEENIQSIRLNKIIEGSSFDDAICQEHGMEMHSLRDGKKIKKIYLAPNGSFLCLYKENNKFIEMNSLNLSWVPLSLFKKVFKHSKKRLKKDEKSSYLTEKLKFLT